MSIVNTSAEQRVVFYDVSWETYLVLAAERNRPGKRISYDQGVMEIMSPGMLHENISALIGRMVDAFTEENAIEVCSSAGTTFKRDDLERGFEADASYYIANCELVRSKKEIDLTLDPPTDLAIEIDISRSSLSKFAIYRSIGVPELWQYDGQTILCYILEECGEYAPAAASKVLPGFPFAKARGVLDRRHEVGETALMLEFREYVREQKVK
ncbi:MAG: Uma2 family endonuclease [Planctomycetales bacterium]|nr:Uma2 family endonuclease [Planctomycetales bacterium]